MSSNSANAFFFSVENFSWITYEFLLGLGDAEPEDVGILDDTITSSSLLDGCKEDRGEPLFLPIFGLDAVLRGTDESNNAVS
jgi:hypothetical protein